jgi:riboflavin kinase/FMN adenylyltransferase
MQHFLQVPHFFRKNNLKMQVIETPGQAGQLFSHCVATIGKYDGMHLGHQRILDTLLVEAADRRLPAVVILSEPQPEEFFTGAEAPPRLSHFHDKVAFLESRGVDVVYRLTFDTQLSNQRADDFVRSFLVGALGVRSLVIGDDFRFGKARIGDVSLLRALAPELGFTVTAVAPCLQDKHRVSSTLVRQYLQAGDCARVSALLGRPYSISGRIIKGMQLGRQIGIPTANMELQVQRLPMSGVFAVRVLLQQGEFDGVANLGFKPTVTSVGGGTLEVHLLDFSDDIYGQHMCVHFLHKLRNEQKFAGLAQLQEQIGRDITQARACIQTGREAMLT